MQPVLQYSGCGQEEGTWIDTEAHSWPKAASEHTCRVFVRVKKNKMYEYRMHRVLSGGAASHVAVVQL